MKSRTRLLLNSLAMTVIGSGGAWLLAATPANAQPTASSGMFDSGYCCNGAACNCCGTSGATCDATGCFCH